MIQRFKPCSYNFDVLWDGDVFFSHACDIIGGVIRLAQDSHRSVFDLSEPNHAGFVYKIEGQVFAAEVDIGGIRLNSIDKYRTRTNQIVGVYRYNVFTVPEVIARWRREMALWIRRRQESGYPINDAIRSAVKWWPFHSKAGQEFCSQDVQTWLKKYEATLPTEPLNPLRLYDTLTRNKSEFEAVLGYKRS